MPKPLTKEIFIERARKVHGDKYNYSKVEYKDSHTPVIILCPIHGEFAKPPYKHLQGHGCQKCVHRSTKYTIDEVKKLIHEKYGDKYDTSLIENYKNNKEDLPLICKEHGYFEASWNDLDNNHGCQKCGNIRNSESKKKSIEEFEKEARLIHGDKYIYYFDEYVDRSTEFSITCKKCGKTFKQTPFHHLQGCGCSNCCKSKLENEIEDYLTNNNIQFIQQKKFEWLGKQSLDFYLPKFNIAIECQGGQHFKPIEHFGGLDSFSKTKFLDERKKYLCEKNGIKLIYYSNLREYDSFLGEKIYHCKNDLLITVKSNGTN